MNIAGERNLMSLQKKLGIALAPLGKGYEAVMRGRRLWWQSGYGSRFRSQCPTVSVGNIAWGGTGKTPMVSWLLDWFDAQQLHPVVLTRGYGARPPHASFVVTDSHLASESGDEPLMLARQHPAASIVVDPLRKRAGAWSQEHLSPDCFILDDGFQHLAVERDVDIVLLRPEDVQSAWNKVIPWGAWREGASALVQAHVFCMKMDEDEFTRLAPIIESRLARFGVPIFSFSLQPECLVSVQSLKNEVECQPHCNGEPYTLISGVGSPEHVYKTATQFFGYAPKKHLVFSDHHAFTSDDAHAFAQQGTHLVCTPKDAVKLERFALPLWTFSLKTVFGSSLCTDISFPMWWNSTWERLVETTHAS